MHIPETSWDKAVVRLHLWMEFPALGDSKSSQSQGTVFSLENVNSWPQSCKPAASQPTKSVLLTQEHWEFCIASGRG